MGRRAYDSVMDAVIVLLVLVAIAALAPRFGIDSRPDVGDRDDWWPGRRP